MTLLKGTHIYLRELESGDLNFLFDIENDESLWEVSGTLVPFTKSILKAYIQNANIDIFEAKQWRLVIVKTSDDTPVGLIDLFNFDPQHRRAGIGIVVTQEFQGQGIATDALKTLIQYCFTTLQLHQVYANILEANTKSLKLFKNQGFTKVGVKKDWILYQNHFKNEILFQLINHDA